MPLGTEVNLRPGDVVLDGVAAPPVIDAGAQPPQFSAHVYCGQTAGSMKTPLGMEVDLWGKLGPHLKQWQGRGLPACQVSS